MAINILKSRKGMFFTIIVIILLSLFLISYTFYASYGMKDSVEKRIETLDSFVKTVERDISRNLYVAGYRYIFLSEKRILDQNVFITDSNLHFQEAFFNGTFYGTYEPMLNGATFSDMQALFSGYARTMNANFTMLNYSVNLTQSDPWNVEVLLTATLLIADDKNKVKWDQTKIFSAKIPIKNFDDPLYLVGTSGKISNKVIQTNLSFSNVDVTNVSLFLNSIRYVESTDAPSFLQRLEGNLSNSSNGVESLVNLAKLTAQDVPIQQKSIVDHIYFSTNNPPTCIVNGLQSWIRLDNSHLGIYNLTCS